MKKKKKTKKHDFYKIFFKTKRIIFSFLFFVMNKQINIKYLRENNIIMEWMLVNCGTEWNAMEVQGKNIKLPALYPFGGS